MEMTHPKRALTAVLAAMPLAGALISPASAAPQQSTPMRVMSNQKMVRLNGAQASYYVFMRNQAMRQQLMRQQTGANAQAWPQLYRNNNGMLYFRNQQNRNVWLTFPQQGIMVPQAALQQYAPGWQRYMGQFPALRNQDPTVPVNNWIETLPGRPRFW